MINANGGNCLGNSGAQSLGGNGIHPDTQTYVVVPFKGGVVAGAI